MFLRQIAAAWLVLLATVQPSIAADTSVEQVTRLIRLAEKNVDDPRGWATDILDVLQLQRFDRSKENACAVIAIVDQESGFVADPAVPGLGRISEQALRAKLDSIPVAGRVVLNWLESRPTPDTSFLSRVRNARTERDLDLVYRAMVAYAGEKSGLDIVLRSGVLNRIIEERNEVATVGSMQVSVKFALEMARKRRWLPMMLDDVYAVRDELYTRHGGLYFGTAQLLGYDSGYDRKVYRFADYNAGRYASRNAAFQSVVARLADEKLALDGDLLSYNKKGEALPGSTATERAVLKAVKRHGLGLSERQVREDLLLEKEKGFVSTRTFLALREAFQRVAKAKPAFAMIPDIRLSSPKITRVMTTKIFAETVTKRYQACMAAK
ncbi:MAG: DUF1615 domain-containing protein [Proteobacteria bacterium]|nr:DUF1615 domain-containing protein [Pseudomonadota bacterium]